jgi:hypothetical protein
MTEKPTNPKDAVGIAKVPLSTVPATVIFETGLGMMEGALKYGRHNYRAIGVRSSVYYDAAIRHLGAWWEGEDTDPDSGLSHVTKAIASLVVLRDAMIQDKLTDDRPPRAPAGWLAALNERAKALLEKYPEPKQAFVHEHKPAPIKHSGKPPMCWALPKHITNTADDHTWWECKPCKTGWREGETPWCDVKALARP